MRIEEDIFCGFKFFCPKNKQEEAIALLKERKDVSLWPYSLLTTRKVISADGLIDSSEGVTLFGICFRNNVNILVRSLAERRIAGYSLESTFQAAHLLRINMEELNELGLYRN